MKVKKDKSLQDRALKLRPSGSKVDLVVLDGRNKGTVTSVEIEGNGLKE